MNTIQMECFLAVAKHLNFSKAAEEVKITQPAVSHQINSLEAELEVRLFHRTSKSVSLTPEGMLFLPDADKILKIAHSAKERLSNHEEPLVLEIGCHNQAELDLLPEALRTLKAEYPSLRPSLHLFPFASLGGLLESGQLHVMFGMKNDYGKGVLRYRELFRCPVVCICSKNHPLAGRESITKDMIRGNIVLCEPHKIADSIFQIQSDITVGVSGSERYIADGYESVLTLVKAEIGCTVLPGFPAAKDPQLCYIPLSDCKPVSFGMFFMGDGQMPVTKRLYQLLKERFLQFSYDS